MKIYKISNQKLYRIIKSMDENDLMEIYDEQAANILGEFFSKSRAKNSNMSWNVIPFQTIKHLWEDYVKTGIVRNERLLDKVIEKMITNTIRLEVTTELAGHGQTDISELCEQAGCPDIEDLSEEEKDDFYWDFLDTKYGRPVSDYGLRPLYDIIRELFKETNAEQRLVLVDRMLNVVHQRGDLAALFVEGGSNKLSELSAKK